MTVSAPGDDAAKTASEPPSERRAGKYGGAGPPDNAVMREFAARDPECP